LNHVSRRAFVGGATAMAASVASRAVSNAATTDLKASRNSKASNFFDLIRLPDQVYISVEGPPQQQRGLAMIRSGPRWQARGVEVTTDIGLRSTQVSITAPSAPLTRIQLRWNLKPTASLLYMGDAWERSYGDLAWRTVVPDRAMPWYFAAHDGRTTHAYGVMTAPAALCFWQVDPRGVSLWLDISNGGMGVMLGQRELAAATIVSREGNADEHPAHAIAEFCKQMCPHPRLPTGPVYGTNNWYYAYGNSSAEAVLRDTDLVVGLAPKSGPKPFSVIDGGWEGDGAGVGANASVVNPRFPDMRRLSEDIRNRGARPGIWIRPALAPRDTNPALLLPMSRFQSAGGNEPAFDPTVPEALQAVIEKMKRVVAWKYELVKHDFSTYDLLGQWGFNMGAQPARPGWSFHDRSKTSAEILLDIYRALRVAAGDDTLLEGCNTVGHLSAGLFELQRTGDDTSGRDWERTRRMGVNTLAYRLPQSGTLFMNDADCVGITKAIPWEMNRQWMDLVARSGTALFVSPGPEATGSEQRSAIEQAFAIAASAKSGAYAADWFSDTTPEVWKFSDGGEQRYSWCGESGCSPFTI
jgi:alpha-galactosidase